MNLQTNFIQLLLHKKSVLTLQVWGEKIPPTPANLKQNLQTNKNMFVYVWTKFGALL